VAQLDQNSLAWLIIAKHKFTEHLTQHLRLVIANLPTHVCKAAKAFHPASTVVDNHASAHDRPDLVLNDVRQIAKEHGKYE